MSSSPEIERKYILTSEGVVIGGINIMVFRIKAVRKFGKVDSGELGGFVENENNLSHAGDCWISGNAKVYGQSCVMDNARVCDNAVVSQNAVVCGDSTVEEDAQVYGNAVIDGHAWVGGKARVFGQANIGEHAVVADDVTVAGIAVIKGLTNVTGDAVITENARLKTTTMTQEGPTGKTYTEREVYDLLMRVVKGEKAEDLAFSFMRG